MELCVEYMCFESKSVDVNDAFSIIEYSHLCSPYYVSAHLSTGVGLLYMRKTNVIKTGRCVHTAAPEAYMAHTHISKRILRF